MLMANAEFTTLLPGNFKVPVDRHIKNNVILNEYFCIKLIIINYDSVSRSHGQAFSQ